MSVISYNGFWGNMACGNAQLAAENGQMAFLIKASVGVYAFNALMFTANYVLRECQHMTGQTVLSQEERTSLFKWAIVSSVCAIGAMGLTALGYSLWPKDLGSCGIVRYPRSDSDF
jgi:hypothetical protein